MIRKDDAALKKIGDDTVKDLIKTGEINKLWDKWFVQPIPPKNSRVGLPVSESTKAAWANPNDKPMEDYAKK
jgi:glutamate/aspartate transport system substrate-binding protein